MDTMKEWKDVGLEALIERADIIISIVSQSFG
jgi:hypothetical protein